MEELRFLVPGIHCGHCAHTIIMELTELDGVQSVDVDVEKREVSVDYASPATKEKIETLMAEINYPVEKVL
jgi:copper chaperone